jgi:hypothetical protein
MGKGADFSYSFQMAEEDGSEGLNERELRVNNPPTGMGDDKTFYDQIREV